MKTTSLEKIIYFQDYVIVDPGETALKERQLLTEEDFRKARESYGDGFEADMGAEAIKKLLEHLNLVELSQRLRDELAALAKKEKPSRQKQRDLTKRLKSWKRSATVGWAASPTSRNGLYSSASRSFRPTSGPSSSWIPAILRPAT